MAGFNPVGSTPVAAIGGDGVSGLFLSPAVGTLYLGAPAGQAPLMLGLKISKVNISIESHPTPAINMSKVNFSVESDPGSLTSTPWASVSIIWG